MPLFVTALGMSAGTAALRVRGMHGHNRIPTALRPANRLSRHPSLDANEARRMLLHPLPASHAWITA